MGQLSVVIILFTFIRFFIFSNGGNLSESADPVDHDKNRRLRKKQSSILRSATPMPARSILARTYYNVETHPPESLDWLNVLVAQTISQFREDARSNNNILHSLDKILNGDSLPSFLVFAYLRYLTASEKLY
jgi:maintenance of morphology protein 1